MTKKGKQSSVRAKAASKPQGPGPNSNPKRSNIPKGNRPKPDRYDSAPVSRQRTQKMTTPNLSSSMFGGDGRIRVRHREYFSDIVSPNNGFNDTSFSIQPGNSIMFPWLSTIAENYESYKFNSLSFEYETMCATSQAGKLLMAVDFDASDAPPINKTQLMADHNAVSSAVWQECCYKASKEDLNKFGPQKFVRTGNVAATDIKTYDIGNLQVATQGAGGSSLTVGELYVSYDVELMTPQINPIPLSFHGVAGTGISPDLILGTAPTITGSLPVTEITNGTTTTLSILRVGQYLVSFFYVGTGLSSSHAAYGTAAITEQQQLGNVADTAQIIQFAVDVINPGDGITANLSGSSTLSACSIEIAQYQYGI